MSQTAHEQSKRPRTILAGPYGHPFHALMITIPIGTWVASFVFDIIAFASDDPEPWAQAARVLILIGIIGAVVAAVFGFLDYSQLQKGTKAQRMATLHMVLNLSVVVVFLIGYVIRLQSDDVPVVAFVLSIVALLALSLSGFLGGELAYRFGVRVADEQTQRAGFERAG